MGHQVASAIAAVGDPDFSRREFADGRGQLVPVGMIGNDQRQLDVALPRAQRMRIQPEAMAVTGSGRRRDQRSFSALGGAMTILPFSSSLGAPVAGRSSPSSTPSSS